jgi:hypothetical protein
MNLELSLLILESVLLAFTLVLLLFSIKEGRAREHLLRGVEKATKTFTRIEYFLAVIDSLTDARREVTGLITGRLPSAEDRKRTGEIIDAIRKMTGAGVKVRYMLPRFHDRLHIGFLYTKAGAEVRYSTCSIMHDFRYMTVDGNIAVIGIPEGTGEKEATKKGYKIHSEGLATILREHFYSCWENATDFAIYLREVMKETNAPPRQLARELSLDEAELESLVAGLK